MACAMDCTRRRHLGSRNGGRKLQESGAGEDAHHRGEGRIRWVQFTTPFTVEATM